MNKKGAIGDQLSLFYVFTIFLLVLGAVVIGSYLSSSKEYDMRMQDAEILSGKISECLSNKIDLKTEQINDLFNTCDLDKSVFDKGLVASIASQDKVFFRYGDVVACGLQDKNIGYSRCKSFSLTTNVDGVETILYAVAGSNLKSEKKNG